MILDFRYPLHMEIVDRDGHILVRVPLIDDYDIKMSECRSRCTFYSKHGSASAQERVLVSGYAETVRVMNDKSLVSIGDISEYPDPATLVLNSRQLIYDGKIRINKFSVDIHNIDNINIFASYIVNRSNFLKTN